MISLPFVVQQYLDCWPEAKAVLLWHCWQTPTTKIWEPRSSWILVSVLVSFIFRLVGYCSVVLLSNKELGNVKYCTIENHLYLWLALCVSSSSTGTSDTRKNASNRDKRITNEKMVQESKRSVFSAQYYSQWVIDRSSMSNQLHPWVIDAIDE